MKITTYGPGGFDPKKPDNNIIEEVEVPDVPAPENPLDELRSRIEVLESMVL